MTFSDFESWFQTNKQFLPPDVKNTYQKNAGYIEFLCAWKEYEAITTPLLQALLQQQYPQLVTAHPSFEPHIAKNVEHRIFELMEEMWLIISKNRAGLSPAQALPELYPKILTWKKNWYQPRSLYKVEEQIKEHVFRNWTRAEVEEEIEKWNQEKWDAFNAQKQVQEAFIQTLQTPLLPLMPELLNIDAAWWDVYVYFMRLQHTLWKDWNDKYLFLEQYGLTAEWLDKSHKELHAHIDTIEEEALKKNPDLEFD
ncbi:MAG: hypothetical protein V4615_13785 [Bacteroidota bacterium]